MLHVAAHCIVLQFVYRFIYLVNRGLPNGLNISNYDVCSGGDVQYAMYCGCDGGHLIKHGNYTILKMALPYTESTSVYTQPSINLQ